MTTFEYLAVFVSIVVGLAVVRLLRGVVAIATGRGLRPYWIHTTWLAFHLIWLPYFWWFTLNWQTVEAWTFFPFFFLVGFSMIVFAAIAVLVPEKLSDSPDLKQYYFRVRRPFFLLMASISALDIVDTLLKGVDNLERVGGIPYIIFSSLVVVGHLVGSWTDSDRYHAIWVVLVVGSFLISSFISGFALNYLG